MANYYLNKNGTITNKPKSDKDKKKQQSQLEYNRQVSEKMKKQRAFKENISKPVDYSTMSTKAIQKERTNIQNQMSRYAGTTDSKGRYTLKGIFDAMSGRTRKKLEKDKTYQTAQDRLNELNSILEQRFNESKEGKSLPMRVATGIENRVVEPINSTFEELREDPVQTAKTLSVGFGEGFRSSTNAIQGSLVDLEKAIFGENSIPIQRQQLDLQMKKINDPWKQTKTYKKLEKGELGEGQQNVYNLSSSAASMIPAIATTMLTGSPTAGSAVFYAQAQDNYYNEGLQRGYDDKQARMYGLTMAGVETMVERLGFDEIGGLGKLSKDSIIKAALGEGAEEYVTPYIDGIIRKYGLQDNVDWKEVNEEAISGSLSAMVLGATLNLAGKGFVKVDALANKINTNQKISPTDLQEAVQEVQNVDPDFINNILDEGANTIDLETIEQVKQDMGIQNQTPQKTSEQVEQKIKEEVKTEQPKQEQTAQDTSKEVVQKQPKQEEVKTAPNATEQQEQLTQEKLTQEQLTQEKVEQPKTQEQPQIIPSTEKKKEGQLQFDLNDEAKNNTYFNNKTDYKKLAIKNNYSKEEINLAEKKQEDVISVSTSEKDTKDIAVMTSPPSNIQQSTTIKTTDGNETKHYNPSTKTTSQGDESLFDYIQNKVTKDEQKEVDMIEKKLNKTIENRIKQLKENGNFDLANVYEKKQKEGLYTVAHLGKNLSTEYEALQSRLINGEDLETEYNNLMSNHDELMKSGKLLEINPETKNQDNLLQWLSQANVLMDTLMEENSSGIYDEVVSDLDYMIDMEYLHTSADIMAMASIKARQNPDNASRYLRNKLVKLYEKEKKYHAFDQTWREKNNPYNSSNNSPYRMNKEERNRMNKLTADLKTINDKINSLKELSELNNKLNTIDEKVNKEEYQEVKNKIKEIKSQTSELDEKKLSFAFQEKLNELDDYANEIMLQRLNGIKYVATALKNAIVTLIKQHNLMSTHVAFFNGASNVVDSTTLQPLENRYYNKYQKKLSKITGIKTDLKTMSGRKIYNAGLLEGITNVGKEFMTGVNISNMNTKYTINGEVDYTNIGNLQTKIRAKSKVGKVFAAPINFGSRVTTAMMSIGDTPKSTAVRNRSLFEMLNQEAIRQSELNGKDSVFYRKENKKSGNVTYYFTDANGDFGFKSVPIKQAESFLEGKNQIEATDEMLDMAKRDGEEATYSQKSDNYFSNIGNNGRAFLNSILPGWGDLTAQFFNVTSNIGVEIYKHSPIAYKDLKKQTKILRENTMALEKLIDEKAQNGIDYTQTAEYKEKYWENYKLQREASKTYAKIRSGALIGTFMTTLAAAGFATGSKDKRDEEKGIQSYSIKIGDKYFSYDFGLFSSVARGAVITQEAMEKDNFLEMTSGLFNGYLGLITEQTVLDNFRKSFLSNYGVDGKKVLNNFLANNISSLTTPGFVKELTLMLDDYTSRSTYSNDTWQYVINKLNANWNRDALPKKFDGWGNTIKKGSNLIDSAWNTFFKNDFISTVKDNKVDNELAEVYQMTKDTSILPLKDNGTYKNNVSSFSYKKTKYVLDDKEKEKFSETYGKSAYTNMDKLFKSSMYKNADYETKVKYIKEIYENARDVAKSEFLNDRGVKYYNTGQQVLILGENNRFEHLPVVEALDSNISYQSARKKVEKPETYNYATTIVKDYDIYADAQSQISQIEDMYSETKDRQNAYIEYVNSCSTLSRLEKAMLIKTKYSSLYKKYDEDIKNYLQSQNLSDTEYQFALKQMGLDKKKKNK